MDKRPVQPPQQSQEPSAQPRPGFDLSLDEQATGLQVAPGKGKSRLKRFIGPLIGVIVALLITIGGLFLWYNIQLAPVNSAETKKVLVTVDQGTTPDGIAELLKEEELIRSKSAFLWYARINRVQNLLQAGTYRLSPSESTQEIIEHLSNGRTDSFSITFLPGHTVRQHRQSFIDAGYSAEEVDAALSKDYESPLFEGKPASADLEGYIYGETYTFGTETKVEAILQYTFAEYYKVIQSNNLVEKFKERGLTLYEGITLASIVQRESGSIPDDMAKIAQVFYNRLAVDMPLGSDPTYQYIADKQNVPRDINIDSPYNTRRYAGLPPGPIASPGVKALIATATPQDNDFLYFLSGDDDVTYFSRSLEEHERNIVDHCQKKCQII